MTSVHKSYYFWTSNHKYWHYNQYQSPSLCTHFWCQFHKVYQLYLWLDLTLNFWICCRQGMNTFRKLTFKFLLKYLKKDYKKNFVNISQISLNIQRIFMLAACILKKCHRSMLLCLVFKINRYWKSLLPVKCIYFLRIS